MRVILTLIGLLLMSVNAVSAEKSLYDFTLVRIDGQPMPLAEFKGHAVMLVNTASECGFTPQYEGLEKLWQTYKDKGLVVIGVPTNDFGGQEPGTASEIVQFCKKNYGVTFPLSDKTVVSGPDANPLYVWAGEQAGFFGRPKWNFHKYLFDGQGRFVDWFSSTTEPASDKITSKLEDILPK